MLAVNIMHFARILRSAGLAIGPGQVLDAIDAATVGGITSKADFYWILHSIFVKRHENSALFEEAFHIFWRKPKMVEQLMQLILPEIARASGLRKKQATHRRIAEAMFPDDAPSRGRRGDPPGALETDATYSFSSEEVLRHKDFEQMTVEEQVRAKQAIAALKLEHFEIPTRRFRPHPHSGRIDARRTLRSAIRSGGNLMTLEMRRRRLRRPPFVVLCDISGSMATYSRMFLHFLHAFRNDFDRVHVFLFGTRLTNVTRDLMDRDPDEAVERISHAVRDWSGGTRIGSCLKTFNFQWSRRVLTQGAHVILMTDGLDRDEEPVLGDEMARLHRSARRVIWLNPLLRFSGFEARARGVRAIMPHVDEFRPMHNLQSLEDIAEALGKGSRTHHDPKAWLQAG